MQTLRRRLSGGRVLSVVQAASLSALAACSAVGPDYQQPAVEAPAAWKVEAGWQAVQPRDGELKGPWWEMFGDAQLNELEVKAVAHNHNLAAAQARLDQARALTALANSTLLPRIGLQGGTSRFQTSANRPLSSYTTANSSVVQSDFNVALSASYELDLSGRVRRQLESARSGEAQSGADFENTRLLVTAQLAISYFSLRELDSEISLIEQTLRAQTLALELVNARHEFGSASGLEVEQQKSLRSGIEAQLQTLRDQRARFEHAIATLTGVAAPAFSLASADRLPDVPTVPLMQPADVLERRPDVASAERGMAAANAQIGIARSGYFPSITLAGLYGNDSNDLPILMSGPSVLWSLGLSATQTLFDGGRTDAAVTSARATYTQATENYRQTVLNALQEVQDGLSTQAALLNASRALKDAVRSATRVYELTDARYQEGAANHLDLVLAEQTMLSYQRQELLNRGQQLLNAVQLVKALGGGWSARPQP